MKCLKKMVSKIKKNQKNKFLFVLLKNLLLSLQHEKRSLKNATYSERWRELTL